MTNKKVSEEAFNLIIEIDDYISERSPSVSINTNPRLTICETGWYTFSANMKWLLSNYDNVTDVPYNQIAFTARYLLEIASDYNYILSKKSNTRLNSFLKQYKTAISSSRKGEDYFKNVTKETFMNDAKINCAKEEKREKTLKRVGLIFHDFGIGHYNLESSCCHCNFCGMVVAANSNTENGLPLRRDTIQIIPVATKEMIHALSFVENYGDIEKDLAETIDSLQKLFKKGGKNE